MMISDFEYKAKKINGCLVIALNFFSLVEINCKQ